MTKEIIQAKDSGRRMWKMIEKLKGSNKREQEKAIYDQNGKLLQERYLKGGRTGHDTKILEDSNHSIRSFHVRSPKIFGK